MTASPDQVHGLLGRGELGEVLLGSGPGPEGARRFLRLEQLPPELRGENGMGPALGEELSLWEGCGHPNLLRVLGPLRDARACEGVVLEWVPALDLEALQASGEKTRRRLPVGLVCRVMRDVARALHALHVDGPLPLFGHDLSPGRVQVSHDGGVYLLPSPLVRVARRLWWDRAGRVKAARGYRSPEEVRGEPLDARSDVFSAGVLMHELLTGRPLFEAATFEQSGTAILKGNIGSPDAGSEWVSRELAAVVMGALAKDAGSRYPSAQAFAEALERVAGRLLFSGAQMALYLQERCGPALSAMGALLGGGPLPATPRRKTPVASEIPQGGAEPFLGFGLNQGVESHSFSPRRSALPHIAWLLLCTTLLAVVAYRYVLPDRRGSSGDGRTVELAVFDEGSGLFGPGKVSVRQADAPPELPVPQPLPSPAGADAESDGSPTAAGGSRRTGKARGAEGGEKPGRSRRGAVAAESGRLTLVTVPEAKVRLGERVLGTTPLFDVALAPGTHLLTLEGPDGIRRDLSVPVRAAQSARFRLKLADLPRSAGRP